jgi:hypothetical protein
VEVQRSTCSGGSGDSLSGVVARRALVLTYLTGGAYPLGVVTSVASMVGVAACTADR